MPTILLQCRELLNRHSWLWVIAVNVLWVPCAVVWPASYVVLVPLTFLFDCAATATAIHMDPQLLADRPGQSNPWDGVVVASIVCAVPYTSINFVLLFDGFWLTVFHVLALGVGLWIAIQFAPGWFEQFLAARQRAKEQRRNELLAAVWNQATVAVAAFNLLKHENVQAAEIVRQTLERARASGRLSHDQTVNYLRTVSAILDGNAAELARRLRGERPRSAAEVAVDAASHAYLESLN